MRSCLNLCQHRPPPVQDNICATQYLCKTIFPACMCVNIDLHLCITIFVQDNISCLYLCQHRPPPVLHNICARQYLCKTIFPACMCVNIDLHLCNTIFVQDNISCLSLCQHRPPPVQHNICARQYFLPVFVSTSTSTCARQKVKVHTSPCCEVAKIAQTVF